MRKPAIMMLGRKLSVFLLTLASVQVSFASPFHSGTTIAPLYIPPASAQDLLNNSYIVILKEDISPSAFAAHLNFVSHVKKISPLLFDEDYSGLVSEYVYNSKIAKGYAGKLSQDAVELIRRRPEVKYVEQDQIIYEEAIQEDSPWVCSCNIETCCC